MLKSWLAAANQIRGFSYSYEYLCHTPFTFYWFVLFDSEKVTAVRIPGRKACYVIPMDSSVTTTKEHTNDLDWVSVKAKVKISPILSSNV